MFADEYLPNELDDKKSSKILQYNLQFGALRLRQLRAKKVWGSSSIACDSAVIGSNAFCRVRVALRESWRRQRYTHAPAHTHACTCRTHIVKGQANCVGAWSNSNEDTEVTHPIDPASSPPCPHVLQLTPSPHLPPRPPQPFGPNNQWTWKSTAANFESPHWGMYQVYGGGGYNIDIFGGADTFKSKVSCCSEPAHAHRVSPRDSRASSCTS